MPRRFQYGKYRTSASPEATPQLSWTTTITAVGATGDVWEAELMGNKVQYVQAASDTTTLVADGIAAALDALAGITSTNAGAVITTTRSAAPTLESEAVGELSLVAYKPNRPFRGGSAGAWTQVVATSGTGLATVAVRQSVPEPHP